MTCEHPPHEMTVHSGYKCENRKWSKLSLSPSINTTCFRLPRMLSNISSGISSVSGTSCQSQLLPSNDFNQILEEFRLVAAKSRSCVRYTNRQSGRSASILF